MSNQGLRQESVRAVTATALNYEGDWLALFEQLLSAEQAGITNFNGRLKDYCERVVGFRFGTVDEAMNAFALAVGNTRTFNELGAFDAAANRPAKVLHDFSRLQVLPPGITFTRASLAWDYDLRQFANNQPTLTPGIGWLLEKNSVNLMQVFNAAPVNLAGVSASGGELILVTDRIKLADAGINLEVHNGNVWRLDNRGVGTESTLRFTTSTVASTSTHASSALARGSGEARIGTTGGLGTATPLTDQYREIEHAGIPGSAASVFEVTVSAGGLLYVAVPMMEVGDILTSPIVTEGATASRIRVLDEEPYTRSGAFAMRVSFVPNAVTSGVRFVVDLSDGTAANRVRVSYSAANTFAGCIVAGAAVNVELPAPTLDALNTVTMAHDGGTGLTAELNGGGPLTATTSIPDTSDIQYGHDWTGNSILNGYVRSIAIFDAAVSVRGFSNGFDGGYG